MDSNQPGRGGGFNLAALITAIATLLTAIATLLTALNAIGIFKEWNTESSHPQLDSNVSSARRVNFPSGTTGTTEYGKIFVNTHQRYVLWCGQGQLFSMRVEGNVLATIRTSSGETLGIADGNGNEVKGYLPMSGDFFVEVSTRVNANYRLVFEVTSQ
jgi:hypothetical protein